MSGEVESEPTAGQIAAADVVASVALWIASFAVYLVTLFPGLGGGGDSAKFQYVGSVLGTPHPPGYPLYVLVSFVFAKLPIGVLAWRINMMSAFLAATAVTVSFLALRRAGCRLVAAAPVSLALAFGGLLWSKAVRAEVYSFAGALTALIAYFAVRWGNSRRERDLYAMVAAFAVSLGNHLTVATLAPGILVYVVAIDRRALRLRAIAVSALLILAGLAQYGFIMLRTLQQAPYLEARASTLRELISVMRATRFSDQVFAFSVHQLIVERLPELWRVTTTEMGVFGTALVFVGLIAAWRRRVALGALLAVGAAGVLVLTVNVNADLEGFLVPAFVLIWMIAGLGFEAVWRIAGAARRWRIAVPIAILVILPSFQLWRNYQANDHHRRTYEIRYFDALFQQLEHSAVIVSEAYAVDQLVLYKLIGEKAAGNRTIELVAADGDTIRRRRDAGFSVYAFSDGRAGLQGSGFRFAPVQLSLRTDGHSGAGTPIDMTPLPLWKMTATADCQDVGNLGWRDVTREAAGGQLLLRIDNYRPFAANVVLYTAGSTAGALPALAISRGPESPAIAVETFATPSKLSRALHHDDVHDDRLLRLPNVQRIEMTVNDHGQSSWAALDLHEHSQLTLLRATVDLNNPKRASVCGWSGRTLFDEADTERLAFGAQDETLLGQNWHAAESSEGFDFRWTSGRNAEVLMPLERTAHAIVRVHAKPFTYPGAAVQSIALSINGADLPARTMSNDWAAYEWNVDERYWFAGFNRVTINVSKVVSPAEVGVSSDNRPLGIAVRSVEAVRAEPPSARSRN